MREERWWCRTLWVHDWWGYWLSIRFFYWTV